MPAPVPPAPPSVGELEASVVTIKDGEGLGSGFIVAPGILLTNRHVVERSSGGGMFTVIFSDPRAEEQAVLLARAEDVDLATLRCIEPAPRCRAAKPLVLGRAAGMRAGASVQAFGSPIGLENTLTRGIVSHRGRRIRGRVYLQTDLAVNEGNSGGPLFDGEGRVIGVVTGKMKNLEGIAFVLPIEYAYEGPKVVLEGHVPTLPGLGAEMMKLVSEATETAFTTAGDRGRGSPRIIPEAPPRWEPVIEPGFVVTEAKYGRQLRIELKLSLPLDKALAKNSQIELVLAPDPHRYQTQPLYSKLPPFDTLNTVERPDLNRRTHWLKIEGPRTEYLSPQQKYHLRFDQRLYSESFTISQVYE